MFFTVKDLPWPLDSRELVSEHVWSVREGNEQTFEFEGLEGGEEGGGTNRAGK